MNEMHFARGDLLLKDVFNVGAVGSADWTTVHYALEVPVLLDAALRRKSSDTGKLNMALVRMADAAHDPARYLREERQLHERIARISTNTLLVNLYLLVLDAAQPTSIPGDVQRHLLVHQHIVDAIVDGNPDLVRRAAKEHRRL
jgi:DNA-binding FadR family transcriptional regulator